jgi:hypothetical protein
MRQHLYNNNNNNNNNNNVLKLYEFPLVPKNEIFLEKCMALPLCIAVESEVVCSSTVGVVLNLLF